MPVPSICRALVAAVAAMLAAAFAAPGLALANSPDKCGGRGLGVSRVVEVDATGGPVFGSLTKRQREDRFLAPKEVVLTFDDGPLPGVTKPVLETLDRFCTKATFFSVGKMAVAYPELIREIIARGHTLGTHTWSHPLSLPRLKGEQARDQIETGFAAAVMAAGQPIAPFFRFPGLSDSPALVAHLEQRNIATFTVDVVSNDSYITDPGRLIERTLSETLKENGGIMLFHDIKPQTARALPTILGELKARGYKVVHLVAKEPFRPDQRYMASLQEHLAKRSPKTLKTLTAFTDTEPAPSIAPAPGAEVPANVTVPADADGKVAALGIVGAKNEGSGDARELRDAATVTVSSEAVQAVIAERAEPQGWMARAGQEAPIVVGQNSARLQETPGLAVKPAAPSPTAQAQSGASGQPGERKVIVPNIINKPLEGSEAGVGQAPAGQGVAGETPAAGQAAQTQPKAAAPLQEGPAPINPAASADSAQSPGATSQAAPPVQSDAAPSPPQVPPRFTTTIERSRTGQTPRAGQQAPGQAAARPAAEGQALSKPVAAQSNSAPAAAASSITVQPRPQGSSLEVIAGSYAGKQAPGAAPVAAQPANQAPASAIVAAPTAPGGMEVLAGSYSAQQKGTPAQVLAGPDRTWEAIRNNGN